MILFTTSESFPHKGYAGQPESNARASLLAIAIFILALVSGVVILDRIAGVPTFDMQVSELST